MQDEFVFDTRAIEDFCRVTDDYNLIHNPGYMYANGKKVVVPGMLLLSLAIGKARELIDKGADTFHLFFNSIICAGDRVDIGYRLLSLAPVRAELTAKNSVDAFKLRDEPSVMYARAGEPEISPGGILRTLPLRDGQMDDFDRQIFLSGNPLGALLFAIAYASNALLRAIQNPVTDTETQIHRLLDKSLNPDQVSPFYQSLKIFLPQPLHYPNRHQPLDYLIDFITERQDKVYTAHVSCSQGGQSVFYSLYRLIAIPDRLIMRMAGDRK